MQLIKQLFFIFTLCVLSAIVVFISYAQYYVNQTNLLTSPLLITIENGASFHSFSEQLVKNNVIANRFWLRNYVRFHRDQAQVKAGTYQLLPSHTLKQILQQVNEGKEFQFNLVFVEGTTLEQWAEQLSSHPNIKQTIKQTSGKSVYTQISQALGLDKQHPEGLFFPDTYAFTHQTSDVAILKRAYAKMQKELEFQWQNRSSGLPYKNIYEALIMASIIEKESGKHAEHELISSVFINRLNEGMRLQTDPTVIYGLGERYQGDIKRKHLKEKTAYNTYRINGLPPTPIAMPGKSAIYAALHPAATDYLYFVSNGQGKHIFSTNLVDHNKAVAEYQLNQ